VRVGNGERVEPDQVLSGASAATRLPAEEFARPIRTRRRGVPLPLQGSGEMLASAGG